MVRELIILRHAHADAGGFASDFERVLDDRGLEQAAAVGAWLGAHAAEPDHAVCSAARRAVMTARGVCAALEGGPELVLEERLYLADVPTCLDVLAGAPRAARRVLLVAHNPGMAELAAHLASRRSDWRPGDFFPPATLAHLALPDDWSALSGGCGELLAHVRPQDLTDGLSRPA